VFGRARQPQLKQRAGQGETAQRGDDGESARHPPRGARQPCKAPDSASSACEATEVATV
jgi:hypothetical protein